MLYRLAPMSTDANRPRVAAWRRRFAAAVCALMLLVGLLPAHAVAGAAAANVERATAVAVSPDDGDAPAAPDALPCHVAGQCSCHAAALPAPVVQRASTLVRPAPFAVAPPHALRPGSLAPPSEPPRT